MINLEETEAKAHERRTSGQSDTISWSGQRREGGKGINSNIGTISAATSYRKAQKMLVTLTSIPRPRSSDTMPGTSGQQRGLNEKSPDTCVW